MHERIQRHLDRLNRLKSERRQTEAVWDEIAAVLAPRRAGFTSAYTPGAKRMDKVFDTAPLQGARGLVSAIDGMMKPKTSQWFSMEPEDEDLREDRDVRAWLDIAEQRLWSALYNPKARWQQATGEADADLVAFGTAAIFCGENPTTRRNLWFKAFHLKNVFIAENADGAIDTVYLDERIPARQAAQRFGAEKLGARSREALLREPDRPLHFVEIVAPRDEIDRSKADARRMAFADIVIDVDSDGHEVSTSGFEEFPFAVPRWDTSAGELYGRGPGWLALPDVQTLNQMGRTLLAGLHRAVDPPWIAPADAIVGRAQNRPGGMTYYNPKALQAIRTGLPIQQLDSRAQLPLGFEAQGVLREQIMGAFFKNVLNLPVQGPNMTATEVIQRREEFVREIGSVFGRLETDYTAPLVERAFAIMLRNAAFPPIPEALGGRGVRFRFASPIEKAKRQMETMQASEAIARAAQLAQFDPAAMEVYDLEEVARMDAENSDLPQRIIRPREAVAQRRQQMQEQQETATALQAADSATRSLGQFAKAREADAKAGAGGAGGEIEAALAAAMASGGGGGG